MQAPTIYSLNASGLVDMVMAEMDYRCRAIEEAMDQARRLDDYVGTVTDFVRCINSGFFEFVGLLDERLRQSGLGDAKLTIDDEQHDLVAGLSASLDWSIKRFSLLRGRLEILLNYVSAGECMASQTITAGVFFFPTEGIIEWQGGNREFFKSYRANAVADARYGSTDLMDLLAGFGISRRGSEWRNGTVARDEPEVLVLRRICQDENWPGWHEP